jgi:hypothetical protein
MRTGLRFFAVAAVLLVFVSIRSAAATPPSPVDALYLPGLPICTEEEMAIDFNGRPPDFDAPNKCQIPLDPDGFDFSDAPKWLLEDSSIHVKPPTETPTITKASGIDGISEINSQLDYATAVFSCGSPCVPATHSPTGIDAFLTAATPSLDWGIGLQNWNNYKVAPRIHGGPFISFGNQCADQGWPSSAAPYMNGMIGIVHGTTLNGVVSDGSYRLIVERYKSPCYADVLGTVVIPNNQGIWVHLYNTVISGHTHMIGRYWNGSTWLVALNIQDMPIS